MLYSALFVRIDSQVLTHKFWLATHRCRLLFAKNAASSNGFHEKLSSFEFTERWLEITLAIAYSLVRWLLEEKASWIALFLLHQLANDARVFSQCQSAYEQVDSFPMIANVRLRNDSNKVAKTVQFKIWFKFWFKVHTARPGDKRRESPKFEWSIHLRLPRYGLPRNPFIEMVCFLSGNASRRCRSDAGVLL